MSESFVCGTGGWVNPPTRIEREPIPEPSNDGVLTATPAFGGIDVNWTLPSANPFAVSYLKLYRGVSADFNLAVFYHPVSGGHFYDKIEGDLGIEYFYWIQPISLNGTVGTLIGPASAYPRGTIEEVIAGLSGRINTGTLAEALRAQIDQIPLVGQDLLTEIQNRIDSEGILGDAIQYARDAVDLAFTYLQEETDARTTADSAQIDQTNLLVAQVNANGAAILEQNTLIADHYNALAEQITTVESTLGDNITLVETDLSTEISTVGTKVTEIGARYTAKVGVNGLIGGFGVYNDGTEVEAGFDVDKFWIGRTGSADKTIPFIVSGDEVFINQAVIQSLSASKISSGSISVNDYIQSSNYAAGTTGWQIKGDGSAEFSTATIRGTILGGGATAYGTGTGLWSGPVSGTYKWRVGTPGSSRAEWTGTAFNVYDASGNVTISSGVVDWAAIGGSNKPADNATVGATFGVNIGGQINASNISTYMANAAIGELQVGVAAIKTAHIGNLQVDTLQMANGSVTSALTSTTSAASTNSGSTMDSFTSSVTLATMTTSANGSGKVIMWLSPDSSTGSTVIASGYKENNGTSAAKITFKVKRNGVIIQQLSIDPMPYTTWTDGGEMPTTYYYPNGSYAGRAVFDTPGPGTYCVYTLEITTGPGVNGSWNQMHYHTYQAINTILLEAKR